MILVSTTLNVFLECIVMKEEDVLEKNQQVKDVLRILNVEEKVFAFLKLLYQLMEFV